MSRQNLSSPLSVLLAGVIMIVLLMAGTSASTGAISRQQSSTPVWTPCPDDDSDPALDCWDFREQLTSEAEDTQFAIQDTQTAAAEGLPTNDPDGYPYDAPSTPTNGTSAPTAAAGVATATPTATLAPAGNNAAPTATDDLAATDAGQAGQTPIVNTADGTPTPTPGESLVCPPGVPVLIHGSAPARAPLLLFFDQRPVGGGSAAPDGTFALKLTVGKERPGEYQVTVRVRGTSQVVRQIACTVPGAAR